MQDILSIRLQGHLFTDHGNCNADEVIKHMLCIQAQDFTQHKRAIASRAASNISQADIEQAYNNGKIVRTWTQRGTLHAIATEDTGWMLKLCASKTLSGFKRRRDFLGISDEIAQKSLQLIQEMLAGNKALTREEISNNLKTSGIELGNGWIYHLLCYSGTLGHTVQGPMKDGNQAFVLYHEWAPHTKLYTEEESLKELCIRYFTSHGPATIADLQRWSGLGIGQIKKGIVLAGDILDENDGYYYRRDDLLGRPQPPKNGRGKPTSLQPQIHFLAGFDEWLLGYKDRSATLDIDHHSLVDASRNGVFKPTFMIDGKTIGTRSTKYKKSTCEVILKPFGALSDSDYSKLQKAMATYQQFIEKGTIVTIV